MKLSDLRALSVADLSSKVQTFEPDVSIAKIVGFLNENNLAEAFISENGRTGIVTLRDLLKVQNTTSTKVMTLMSYVPRLNKNNNVEDAANLMFQYRIRSVPIYENGTALGKIDSYSIIKKLLEIEPDTKVNRIMTPDPITVGEDDEIGKARQLMIRRKIDQIPVTNDGKIKGVVTSANIVYNTLPRTDRDSKGGSILGRYQVPVRDFSTPDYVENQVSDSLQKVFRTMDKLQTTYSIITSYDEIQGIVTHRDFMQVLAETRRVSEIPMYMVGLPEDPFEAQAAREKFERIANLVRKSNPDVLEARAIIKFGETKSARKRYRVQIFIVTPRQRFNYTESGFELPDIFDEIEKWAKKFVSREEPRKRRSRRDPGVISDERADLWTH